MMTGLSRSMMLFTSLIFFSQPIKSFEISLDPQPELSWPFSLADCQDLAANQQAGWKETYNVCMKLFLNKPRDFLPETSQSGSVQGVAMTTDRQFQGVANIDTHILPLKPKKVSRDRFLPDHHVEEDIFMDDTTSDNDSDDGRDDNDGRDEVDGSEGDPWRSGSPQKKWSSLFSSQVLRTRRQHSLSINSALVSLADMLVARDYSRKKERQRTFRQQLLGLGR